MANTFEGFEIPRNTPVPDILFDHLLPDLSGAELKVLMYVIRHTNGWGKDRDNISLSQFLNGMKRKDGTIQDRGTGLSKKTLLLTIKSLVEKNMIISVRNRTAERGDQPTTYRLHIKNSKLDEGEAPRGNQSTPGGVEKSTPEGSGINYPSQETHSQETDLQFRTSKADSQEDRNEVPSVASVQSTLPDLSGSQTQESTKAGETYPPRTGSTRTIGEILVHHQPAQPQHSQQPLQVPAGKVAPTPQIEAVVESISGEFADTAHLRSNISQAANLWQASGRSEASFVSSLYEARSMTKHQHNVRRPMPYFWITLRDQLHLKKEDLELEQTTSG